MAPIACAPPIRYTSSTPAIAAAASVTAGHPTGWIGRHTQDDLGDAGHSRRDGRHQHGARIDGPSAGHVAARPVDRLVALLDRRCRRARRRASPTELVTVEVLDALRGRLEGAPQRRVESLRARRRSRRRGRAASSSTTWSNRSVSSRTAASPRSRTSARIACTAATGPSPDRLGARQDVGAGRRERRAGRVVAARSQTLPARVLVAETGIRWRLGR